MRIFFCNFSLTFSSSCKVIQRPDVYWYVILLYYSIVFPWVSKVPLSGHRQWQSDVTTRRDSELGLRQCREPDGGCIYWFVCHCCGWLCAGLEDHGGIDELCVADMVHTLCYDIVRVTLGGDREKDAWSGEKGERTSMKTPGAIEMAELVAGSETRWRLMKTKLQGLCCLFYLWKKMVGWGCCDFFFGLLMWACF